MSTILVLTELKWAHRWRRFGMFFILQMVLIVWRPEPCAGTLWASSLIGSFAYNFSQPNMKTSVKLIHARYNRDVLSCWRVCELLKMFWSPGFHYCSVSSLFSPSFLTFLLLFLFLSVFLFVLGFVFSFKFCWVSQHHCWVCQLLLVLWQKLSGLVESITGNWWSQWGCHCRWSIAYILLLKVSEHAYDCHCYSDCSLVLFLPLLSLFSMVGSPLSYACWLVAVLSSNLKYW